MRNLIVNQCENGMYVENGNGDFSIQAFVFEEKFEHQYGNIVWFQELENGVKLYEEEWNGERYEKEGEAYIPVYHKNGEDDFEIIGYITSTPDVKKIKTEFQVTELENGMLIEAEEGKSIKGFRFEPYVSPEGNGIKLQNGVILMDFEWNGERYQNSDTGVHYIPVYHKNGEDDFEIIGFWEGYR